MFPRVIFLSENCKEVNFLVAIIRSSSCPGRNCSKGGLSEWGNYLGITVRGQLARVSFVVIITGSGTSNINTELFVISEKSDAVEKGQSYSGIVCYSLGKLASPGNGIKSLETYIKDITNIKPGRNEEEKIHGVICREYLDV